MDRRRFLQSGLATAATVGLAGCPGGEGESTTTDRGAETDAETRVMHYNVFVDGELRQQLDTIGLLNDAEGENAFTAEGLRFETTLQGFTPGETYNVHMSAVDSLSNESVISRIKSYTASGEVEIAAEIPRAESEPTVDGELDESWDGERNDFQHAVMGDPEEADLSGGWRARWDDDALYLHVDVVDDREAVDSAELYNDDSIEVYVDADYSNLPSYDGQNDYQIVAARGADDVSAGVLPNDLSPEMAWNETDDGYELEIAFQWSNLAPDQTIEAGHVLGFDVHVNDDDDGSDRDKKLTWFNEQDDSWENPSSFAAVELTE